MIVGVNTTNIGEPLFSIPFVRFIDFVYRIIYHLSKTDFLLCSFSYLSQTFLNFTIRMLNPVGDIFSKIHCGTFIIGTSVDFLLIEFVY